LAGLTKPEWALSSKSPQYTVRTIHLHRWRHDELYRLDADPVEKVRADMHDLLFAWYDAAKNPYRPRGSQ